MDTYSYDRTATGGTGRPHLIPLADAFRRELAAYVDSLRKRLRRGPNPGLAKLVKEYESLYDAVYGFQLKLEKGHETGPGIAVGDRVSGGKPGTEDYDEGKVLRINGDMAEVGWDSGVRTEMSINTLRRLG